MTTRADLEALIARLEAAKEGSRELDATIWLAIGKIHPDKQAAWDAPVSLFEYACRSVDAHYLWQFSRSVDAALTLVPKGIKWWWVQLDDDPMEKPPFDAKIGKPDEPYASWHGRANSAPLALCIAALRARLAEMEDGR